MKDIPVFATDNGIASLGLQQIPYTGFAHITIHSSTVFNEFLEDCVGFCRAVGAKRVLACGHNGLELYPIYTVILSMQRPVPEKPGEDCLFPVTEKSVGRWLDIYNDAMVHVPNAVILSKQMARELMEKGSAYFVHHNGDILGIGAIENDTIKAVVSCKKGAGERVMLSLCGALSGVTVKVEVAENNEPAMRLYRRMGFISTGILKTWYDVTKNISDVK